MARARPSIDRVESKATTQSSNVGNAKKSEKCSAKLVSREVKEHPTSLPSSFVVRRFGLQEKKLMFPLVVTRCHVMCAWNRRLNTKMEVEWCVSLNQM